MRPQKRVPQFQWDKQLRQYQWDCRILKKISTTLFIHRQVVFSTKLRQKARQIRDKRLKLLASAVSTRPGERLCGFNETSEADFTVSMRPRKWIWRSQWDCGSGFSGLNETVEADSAVSMRLQKRIQQSQWDRGILCDTVEALAKTNIGSWSL
jgi:hypothetical protein